MRKLGLISSLWAALLFFPLSGHALGLGEIEISSFLNQPLKAEISVISARPGEIDDLLISLASRDAFQKAGLDRPAELSKIRFNVEKSEDGQSALILVTTKTPVIEPFLSFLVEADWAKGRLLREFTVLLDPPSFAQQDEEPAATVTPEAQPKSTQQQLIERTAPPRVEKPAAQPVDTQPAYNQPIAMSGDDPATRVESRSSVSENNMPAAAGPPAQLTVGKGDTLWRIATDLKDRNQSVAQMMLALQMENPAAFGRNNINNLKVGAILRVPEPASVNRLSRQEAQAQVLDQNGLWDDYLARKSGATTRGAPAAVADAGGVQKKPKSQLKLVAPGDGKSNVASLKTNATTSSDNQLRKQLALAEEELEAARLQNNDLNSRVQILEQQLSKFEELQNMVQIQDNSLAQLQKSVSDTKSATSPEPGSKAVPVSGTTPNLDPLLESAIVDAMPTQKMVEAAGEMMEKESQSAVEKVPAGAPPAMVNEMQETAVAMTPEQALPSKPTADELIPAPVIVTEVSGPVLDDDLMNMLPSLDGLMKDPVVLGGLGGVLALILGFLFLKRKKTDKSESAEGITLEGPDSLLDDDVTPVHVPSPVDEDKHVTDIELDPTTEFKAVTVDTESEEEDEDEFTRTAIIAAEEMPEMEEAPSVEQDDVLNEVDVYLAYGLYDNAEDLLNESLENSPERADYRAKLLDTYFATKNREAFIKEATILRSQGKAANRFWDRIQVMGFELAPDNDLFSDAEGKDLTIENLEYTRPASADFDIGAEGDGLNLETDFDLSGDGASDSFDISSTDITKIAGEEEEDSSTEQSESINIDFPDLDENEEENLFETDDLLKQDDAEDEEEPTEHTLADDLETLNFDGEMEDFRPQAEDENKQEDEDLSFDLSDDTGELVEQQVEKDAQSKSESGLITDEVPVVEEMRLDATMDELEVLDTSPSSELSDVEPDQKVDGETHDIAEEEESPFDKTHIVAPGSDLEDESVFDKTHIIAPGSDPDSESAESPESEISLDEGLDFDMSDMDEADLHTGSFTPSEMDQLSEPGAREDDITEFKPADFIDEFENDNADNLANLAAEEIEDVEEINIEDDIEGFDVDESIGDIMDDINLDDGIKVEEDIEDLELGGIDEAEGLLDEASIDSDSGDDDLTKTGTFAPGEFKEDTASQDDLVAESDELDGLDDIEDLMLPDDVDEVGTKLDLARAFMDMGDLEGARSSLDEVLTEGTEEQKAEAVELMNQMK